MGHLQACVWLLVLGCCFCASVDASRQDGNFLEDSLCAYGEVQLEDGCGCAPGYGSSPAGGPGCSPCSPGTFSEGGSSHDPRPPCQPCGPHFTSPHAAVSAQQCTCEAGFGAALLPLNQYQAAALEAKRRTKAATMAQPKPSTAASIQGGQQQAAQQQLPFTPTAGQQLKQGDGDSTKTAAATAGAAGGGKVGIAAVPGFQQEGYTQSTQPAGGVGDRDFPSTPRARTIKIGRSPPAYEPHRDRPYTREPHSEDEPAHTREPYHREEQHVRQPYGYKGHEEEQQQQYHYNHEYKEEQQDKYYEQPHYEQEPEPIRHAIDRLIGKAIEGKAAPAPKVDSNKQPQQQQQPPQQPQQQQPLTGNKLQQQPSQQQPGQQTKPKSEFHVASPEDWYDQHQQQNQQQGQHAPAKTAYGGDEQYQQYQQYTPAYEGQQQYSQYDQAAPRYGAGEGYRQYEAPEGRGDAYVPTPEQYKQYQQEPREQYERYPEHYSREQQQYQQYQAPREQYRQQGPEYYQRGQYNQGPDYYYRDHQQQQQQPAASGDHGLYPEEMPQQQYHQQQQQQQQQQEPLFRDLPEPQPLPQPQKPLGRYDYRPDGLSPAPEQQQPAPAAPKAPAVDHAEWWEQQRQMASQGRRSAQKSPTPRYEPRPQDHTKPRLPYYPEPSVPHYELPEPVPMVPPHGPEQLPGPEPQPLPEHEGEMSPPKFTPRYDIPREMGDGVVELFGRSWDTKVCAPCPRGFYTLASPAYTLATPATTPNATAAAAASAAVPSTAAKTAAATATVATAATTAPATQPGAATPLAATTAAAPAATTAQVPSYYGSQPRAQLCERCLSEEGEAGGFITPEEGTDDAGECGCAAGHGGVGCTPCQEGFFSHGGRKADCQICPNGGQGFTTMPTIGARDVDDCVCLPGYGFDGEACELCPLGTWSRGYSRAPCKPCPHGQVSPQGSTGPEECEVWEWECPVGQWAPEGALSPEDCRCYPGFGGVHMSGVPCHVCPPGTFSEGGNRGPCQKCGKGETSNPGASSKHDCFPVDQHCPPGSVPDSDYGKLLSGGSHKHTITAKTGAKHAAATAEVSVAAVGAPAGGAADSANASANATQSASVQSQKLQRVYRQTPPEEGHSKQQEGPGSSSYLDWDPQAAYDSARSNGYYYDVEGYVEKHYHPFRVYGEEAENSCVCKPGHGSHRGSAPCHECPPGTWSAGGDVSPCQLCPNNAYSPPGSVSVEQCETTHVKCKPGMFAPAHATSEKDCLCMAGRGGIGSPDYPCSLCPAGTFSRGGFTDPCTPCPAGMKAPRGSLDISYCHPDNICPMGTWVPDSFSYYSDENDEILPGLAAKLAGGASSDSTGAGSVGTAAAAAGTAAADAKVETSQFLGLVMPKQKQAAGSNQGGQKSGQQKPKSTRMDDISFIGMGGSGGKKAAAPSPWQILEAPTKHKDSGSGSGSGSNNKPAQGNTPFLINHGKSGSNPPRSSSSTRDVPRDSRQGSKGPSREQQQPRQQPRQQQQPKGTAGRPMPVNSRVGGDGGRRSRDGRDSYRHEQQQQGRRYYPHKKSYGYGGDHLFFDMLTRGNSSSDSTTRCLNKRRKDYSLFDELTNSNIKWVNCTDDYGPAYDAYGDEHNDGYHHSSGDYYYGDYGSSDHHTRNGSGSYHDDLYMDWLLGSERRHGRDRDGEQYYGDDDGRHGGRDGHGRGRDRGSHQEEREYDRYGYDEEGYDKEGYDRDGYDQDGYDPYGFDRRGRFRGNDGDEGRRGDRDLDDEDSEADGGYGQPEEPAERDDEYYYDMMPPQYAVADDCTCRPGFGSKTGEEGSPCYKCPAGSYSPGNSYAPCRACPDGYTSAAGSTHAKHCVPLFKECGIGGYLPEASLAHEGCHAYPGYGLQHGEYDEDEPRFGLCPPGTFSEGHSRKPCQPCDKDETSHAGAWREEMCHAKSHYDSYDRAALYAKHARVGVMRRKQASTRSNKGSAAAGSSSSSHKDLKAAGSSSKAAAGKAGAAPSTKPSKS